MKRLKLSFSKVIFIFLLLIVPIIIFTALSAVNVEVPGEKPVAQNGVLDLRNWNFDKQGMVNLDGQWEFYYGQLLTPDDFKTKDKPVMTGFINIPGNFYGYNFNGQTLGRDGYATYRLRVLTNSDAQIYGIKTDFIDTAHKMWVNDKVILQSGTVGKSKSDMTPEVAPKVGVFYANKGELDITLQVSNFYASDSQIDTILLGNEAQISNNRARSVGFDLFLFASTLVAAVYHFSMYFRRRKDKAPLYFAIVCVLVGLRTTLVGERILNSLIPNFNFLLDDRLLLWTFFLYIPILVLFIDTFYKNILWKVIVKASNICGIVYFIIITFLPPRYYNQIVLPVEIISDLLLLYILCRLIYKYLFEGERYDMAIIGIFVLLLTRVNDILYEYSLIQTGSYASVGMLIFIFAQSYILAGRYSLALSEVEEMTEKLKSINKLKDDFLANTSHELKTPLNGIIGLTQGLTFNGSGTLSSEQSETINLIQASAKRLSNLVNDILDFSKLKNNDLNLVMKSIDVRQLVNVVIKFCEPFVRNKKVIINNNIQSDIPSGYGDEDRIQQILYNLIGNAVKFTPNGEVTISAQEKYDFLEITVSDTGIGISKEQLLNIFSPYEQGEGIDKRYGGTGLGLYITKKLVKLHGGDIRVESEPDKGSRFIFTIPKCSVNTKCLEHEDMEQNKLGQNQDEKLKSELNENSFQRKRRILIVDDDPINIRVLKKFLEQENYEVITASNGMEALNTACKELNMDLIVLDLMLPDMMGFEVCSRLRENFSAFKLPIIIMTADNRSQSLVTSFECGANDYLKKPFDRSELIARVNTLIALKTSVEEAASRAKEIAEVLANDKMKTEFFANISHELKTPLNVIWGTVQLLQTFELHGNVEDAKVERYLKVMNQNSLRLLRLINNLIDTTKIESGYLSLNLSNNNMVYVVEEITLSAADYIKAHGIDVVFDTDVEEKYMAFDSDKIERIMLNILSNAVKFTDPGGTIFVNIYDLEDKIKIIIRDTGIGIPEDKLETIFERFSQVDRSLSRNIQGSGIGLSLVKSLVEMHGGKVYASSKLGEGTEFIMEFPVTLVEEDSSSELYCHDFSDPKNVERIEIEFSDIYG